MVKMIAENGSTNGMMTEKQRVNENKLNIIAYLYPIS
jgi:hypothetical protein